MTHSPKSRQSGFSFFGVVFILVVLVSVGAMVTQVLPTALEYQAALKAAQKASDSVTMPEVRQNFDKAAQIDDIRAIRGKDLEIVKNGDKWVVKFAYNKEIHMFGPAYLLLKYAGQSK